jgi:hypothetical protein
MADLGQQIHRRRGNQQTQSRGPHQDAPQHQQSHCGYTTRQQTAQKRCGGHHSHGGQQALQTRTHGATGDIACK